jgi:hypothetical protein
MKYIRLRCNDVLRETSISVAPQHSAIRTEVGLSFSAVEACSTEDYRIDNDPIPQSNTRIFPAIYYLSDYLMPHDQRMSYRNGSEIDFEIRSANASVGDPNLYLAHFDTWGFYLLQEQVLRGS